MGTAVLSPQDCLPISRSRHRSHLSDAYPGSLTGCKSMLQFHDAPLLSSIQGRHRFTPYHGGGPLYLDQARHGFAPYVPSYSEGEVELMFNRQGEARAVRTTIIAAPNSSAFSTLHSPRKKEAARDLFLGLLTKSDACRFLPRVPKSKLVSGAKGSQPVAIDRRKKNDGIGKKDSIDSEVSRGKLRPSKLAQPKFEDSDLSSHWTDVSSVEDLRGEKCYQPNGKSSVVKGRRSFDSIYGVTRPDKGWNHQSHRSVKEAEYLSSKATNEKKYCRANAVGPGMMRLQHASTDSRIVEHLSHHQSRLLDIPIINEVKTSHGFSRSSSMPLAETLPERWAGPAYFSSPAPSSLPLPSFSRLSHKTSSLSVSPVLGEQKWSNITKPIGSGSVSALSGSLLSQGEVDAVFATNSLRKMLKLDPV